MKWPWFCLWVLCTLGCCSWRILSCVGLWWALRPKRFLVSAPTFNQQTTTALTQWWSTLLCLGDSKDLVLASPGAERTIVYSWCSRGTLWKKARWVSCVRTWHRLTGTKLRHSHKCILLFVRLCRCPLFCKWSGFAYTPFKAKTAPLTAEGPY
jgi:hypothetical protein